MENGCWSLSGEKGTEEHHGKWVLENIRGMDTDEHHGTISGEWVLKSIMGNGYPRIIGEKGAEDHHTKWVLEFIRGMGTEVYQGK